jgi:hypothetical protein
MERWIKRGGGALVAKMDARLNDEALGHPFIVLGRGTEVARKVLKWMA